MQLTALKAKTYTYWQRLHKLQGAFVEVSTVTSDRVFKQEMRGYGDLRRKATWERAFTSLLAKIIYDYTDDNRSLILLHFLQCPREEGITDLTPLLLEQFLMFPDGLNCILDGLREIAQRGTSVYSISVLELRTFAHEFHAAAIRTGRATELAPAGVAVIRPTAA